MSMIQGGYIKTEHCRVIVSGRLSYFTITAFSTLIFAWAVCPGAGAQTSGQLATNPTTTDGNPVSAETNTASGPPSSAVEQPVSEPTTTAGNLVTTGTTTPGPPGPTAVQPPAAKPETKPKINPCATAEVEGETWLDQTHDFVDKNLCEPAVWFDSFFGEDRVLEDVRPSAFVKLRESARWTDGQGLTYIPDFTYRYRLPRLERLLKKARLVIESKSTADKFTTQPGQAIDPGLDPATGTRSPTIGVRTDFLTWLRSLVSIDTGIKAHWPLDPFARLRYQYTKPFAEVYVIRFNETALWRYIEHFTETSELDLERKITTFTILRWSNFATYTQGTAGVAWNTGLSLITQLTPKSAISYNASMWGVTHPDRIVQNYRIGSLYRRNFYRSWLFFELSPEVTWPKNLKGQREPVYAFTGTLEVQFGQ
jgi:hypothetical protein